MNELIDEFSIALELATRAHYGQVDKLGEPYILHPIRVMLNFTDEKLRIIALLHDTIEDTDLELSDLDDAGFSDSVILAIESLTKLPDENYIDYLVRVKNNHLAKEVKLADIKDNIIRLDVLYKVDRQEARKLDRKYSEAKKFLLR